MKINSLLKLTFLILMIPTIFSCSKKDSGGSDVQKLYKCSCSGKSLDWDFGGYDTYNDTVSVMATSSQDAKNKCDAMDFKAGEEYQDCSALPQ